MHKKGMAKLLEDNEMLAESEAIVLLVADSRHAKSTKVSYFTSIWPPTNTIYIFLGRKGLR